MKSIEIYLAVLGRLADIDISVKTLDGTTFGIVTAWSFKFNTCVMVQIYEGLAIVHRFVDGVILDSVEGMYPRTMFDDMFVLTHKEATELANIAYVAYFANEDPLVTQRRVDRKVVEEFGTITGDLELKFDTRDYFVI